MRSAIGCLSGLRVFHYDWIGAGGKSYQRKKNDRSHVVPPRCFPVSIIWERRPGCDTEQRASTRVRFQTETLPYAVASVIGSVQPVQSVTRYRARPWASIAAAVALPVAAVAIGMLLRFGIEAGRVAARGPAAIAVMAVTFVAVGLLRWPMLAVVAVIAPISIAACWPRGGADA